MLVQGHFGTAPETSRNALSTSQGTNEDDSQNDPYPEAGIFHNQMTQNSGQEDGHDTSWVQNFVSYVTTKSNKSNVQKQHKFELKI